MRTWVTTLVEDLWPWWIVSPLLVYCLHAGWQKYIASVVVPWLVHVWRHPSSVNELPSLLVHNFHPSRLLSCSATGPAAARPVLTSSVVYDGSVGGHDVPISLHCLAWGWEFFFFFLGGGGHFLLEGQVVATEACAIQSDAVFVVVGFICRAVLFASKARS